MPIPDRIERTTELTQHPERVREVRRSAGRKERAALAGYLDAPA